MKLKSLLLCGGVLAVTTTQAALTVTEREIPVPASSEAVVDGETEQYLYNVGVHGYLLGANDYNTRASYSTVKGYKVKLTSTGEGTISITDYVETQNSWKKMFCNSETGIWVDNNAGANCDTWVMTTVDGNTFTIGNTAFEGVLLGGQANAGDTRLYFKDASTEDFHTLWYAVSAEEYAAHLAKAVLYEAAAPLWPLLVEADGMGIDVSAQEQVYANPDATASELAAAVEAVQTAIVEYKAADATVENPVDLTVKITNADFAGNSGTGWLGDGFAFQSHADAEHFSKTYNTYQELTNLPSGVYALTTQGYYRAGDAATSFTNFKNDAEKNALLYAVNKVAAENASDTLTSPIMNIFTGIEANNSLGGSELSATEGDNTYYVPNDMATAKTYFDAGYYAGNQVLFAVTEGTALVGVKKDRTIGNDWSIFNNFGLTFYGNGADAYAFWNKSVIEAMPTYEGDDVVVTASVVEAYEDAKSSAAAGATTYEEVKKNIAAVTAAQALVDENIAAWKAYQEQLATARTVASNENYSGPDVGDLADYCDLEADDIISAREFTTEQVIAETAKLKTMCEDAIQNSIQVDTDVTELLKNADFSAGKDGWTFQSVSGGNVAANASAKCAEAWNNADFDIYQVIENAPVGAYTISVQGFYRRGRGDAAWQYFFDSATGEKKDNVEPAPAYVYLNDSKTSLMSVFEYAVPEDENYYTATGNAAFKDQFGFYFPNSMEDAGLAFDHGEYVNTAVGVVAAKGDPMRIGMKGNTTQEGDSWAIFTRFKLIYKGFDVAILKEPLETAIADIRTKTNNVLGADVKAKAEELAATGEKALQAEDGRDMHSALAAIYAYGETIDASVALFAALNTNLDDIENLIAESEAADEVKANVAVTINNIRNSMESYTDAEATEAGATLAECRYQLALPAGYENASDAEPVDLTGLMQTPSFEKDGTNSLEGWEGTSGYNYGNDATQKAALALEFYDKNFDMYQDITVPNGTYQISVNAFNRAGSTSADYTEYAAGTASKAQLYAQSGETEISKPIEHLTSIEEAASEKLGLGSETEFNTNEEVTYYVPNDMVSSVAYFDQGRYINGVTIKVTDGKLRVGIRQANKVSGSWVIMDAFKLMYLGSESKAEEGTWTAVEGVENAAEVKTVEVYTVDGIRQNSLQNGINIVVVTDAEGNVTTKTVIK